MEEDRSAYVSACTRPLADDPALRLEVEQELKTHLEEAREEEMANGSSPQEAEARAERRFGDPEELAHALFLSNRKRLSIRAKIRLLLKLAALPLLIAGMFLCMDFRTLAGVLWLGSLGSTEKETRLQTLPARILNRWDLSRLPEREQLFLSEMLHPESRDASGEIERLRRLRAAFPENRIILALLAQTLALESSSGGEEGKPFFRTAGQEQLFQELQALLREGRKQDPENALYDYLEAFALAAPAIVWEQNPDAKKNGASTIRYHVRDRVLLERAMSRYKDGLRKPFLKTGCMEFPALSHRMLRPANDFFGQVQKISISISTVLPHLNIHRQLAREVILYEQALREEGKTAEADRILRSWKIFLRQLLNDNRETLIEVLVCHAIGKCFLDQVRQRNDSEEIRLLTEFISPVDHWKEQPPSDNNLIRKHGGWLHQLFLPGLRETIPPEQLAPGRYLSYALCDLFTLALLSVFLGMLITAHAAGLGIARLSGRHAFFLFLPWKSYLRIGLAGIAAPLALWLLFTRIDIISGRGWAPGCNGIHLAAEGIFLVFVLPLFYGCVVRKELKRCGKRFGFPDGVPPRATLSLNLLFFYLALLCVTGGILRPVLNLECRARIADDPFFFSGDWNVLKAEHRTAAGFSERMLHTLRQNGQSGRE